MTLPLALLCTGAALDFRSLRHDPRDAVLAALGKLLVVPLLFVLAAWPSVFAAWASAFCC